MICNCPSQVLRIMQHFKQPHLQYKDDKHEVTYSFTFGVKPIGVLPASHAFTTVTLLSSSTNDTSKLKAGFISFSS